MPYLFTVVCPVDTVNSSEAGLANHDVRLMTALRHLAL